MFNCIKFKSNFKKVIKLTDKAEKFLEKLKQIASKRKSRSKHLSIKLESYNLNILKSEKDLNDILINFFTEILMNQSYSSFKLWCQEYISERYKWEKNKFILAWKNTMRQSVILNSDFIPSLMKTDKKKYDNFDLWLIKTITKNKKNSIKQIIIPAFISNIWMIIYIEIYSLQIYIYNPINNAKTNLLPYINKLQEYINQSRWFLHNYTITAWELNLKGEFKIVNVPWSFHVFHYDTGVIAWLIMYTLYQGIKPINIDQFSKRRRRVLYKTFRDVNIDNIYKLFYKDTQTLRIK